MENIDKVLTVPKSGLIVSLVLIVWSKIPQMPQNLSAQFVCPSSKVLNLNGKRLHWASVVRVRWYSNNCKKVNEAIPELPLSASLRI